MILTGLFIILLAAGFVLFLLFRFAPPEPGFPYYQLATPVFLSIFVVSLPLVFKATSRFMLPVRIGALVLCAIAFLCFVPVQVIVYTSYQTHCSRYSTVQEWKSVSYSLFSVGAHLYWDRPDYACPDADPADDL